MDLMAIDILELYKIDMKKLSVVYATRNEEDNIERSLLSVKNIADEIIIFDEHSTDKTTTIARQYGARVYDTKHEDIFHITKQKAIDKAEGEWILQLDADEVVTPALAGEIRSVITMSNFEIQNRKPLNTNDERLFKRHLKLLQSRGEFKDDNGNEIVAFFLPRINMFLGKPLIHGGVYPDGVVRLIKKGKASLPAKSVHEQMKVDGKVAWLFNPLEHWDSPTVFRYLSRLNRYTDLHAEELSNAHLSKSTYHLLQYSLILPIKTFVDRYFVHSGYKDGLYGFVWAFFSAWHFPISYFKFATNKHK